MNSIDGLSQVIQILRRKLTDRSPASLRRKNPGTQESPHGTRAESKANVGEVRRKICERIKSLPPGDRRKVKAVQIFVEGIMIWEFGEQLLQDPRLAELSREVADTLAENPETWRRMQALLDEFNQN